jgi:hypothetical protein
LQIGQAAYRKNVRKTFLPLRLSAVSSVPSTDITLKSGAASPAVSGIPVDFEAKPKELTGRSRSVSKDFTEQTEQAARLLAPGLLG